MMSCSTAPELQGARRRAPLDPGEARIEPPPATRDGSPAERRAGAALAPPAGVAPDRATLRRLADLVSGALGICLPDGKLTMLHGRLQRRLRALGMTSLAAYELRLADPRTAGAERAELFDLATTNKTDFFREPDHFTYLMEVALPALAAGRSRWLLRLWSAGCATGQEAYTLAMLLDDHAGRHPGFDFAITATDVSMRALREAHQATYAVGTKIFSVHKCL